MLAFMLLISTVARSIGSAQNDSIQSLMRNSRYSEALTLIDKALSKEPSNWELFTYKGIVCRALYSYDHAIKAYQDALTLNTSNQELLTALASTYKLSLDYPNAIQYYIRALANDSTNLFLKMEVATCKLLNDQYEDAVVDFTNLYQLDSLNTYVLKSLGYSYNQMDLSHYSILLFQKALRVKPNDGGCVLSLANLFIKEKRYADGIQVTDAYRLIDSTNREVNSKNAYLYLLDKRYNPAIQKFENCIEAGDTTEFVYKNLGIACYSIDAYDEAKGYLEKAHEMDLKDASTLHYLGISCYRSYYKELGVIYLEKALKLYQPTEEKIALLYKNYAEACKGWDKCSSEKKISSAQRAFEFNPLETTFARDLATEYELAKDTTQAIKYYEIYLSTLKEDPKTPVKYSLRASYLYRLMKLKGVAMKKVEQTKP